MWNLFGQGEYSYSYSVDSVNGAEAGLFAGFMLVWLLFWLAIAVVMLVAMWKIFTKAGVEGWKALIPVYNYWTLCEIVGKPGWWGLIPLLMIIPIVNFIAWIPALILSVIVSLELGKAFGKDTVWSVFLLIVFSFVGYLILGFGKDKYDKSRLTTNMSGGSGSAGAPPVAS